MSVDPTQIQKTPKHPLVVKRGATFDRALKFRVKETGQLVSLDGLVSAKLFARPDDGSDPVELLTGGPSDHYILIDYVNKKIRLYIAASITANYTWGSCEYYFQVTDSLGTVKRRLRGPMTLEEEPR